MKIINLTPHPVAMYDMDDVVPGDRKRGYYVRDYAEPVAVYPSQDVARASCVEETVGRLDGHDLVDRVYGPPRHLPDPQDGVYYIVTALVAQAAWAHGRRVDDLLLVVRQVRDMQDKIVGYAAFARL